MAGTNDVVGLMQGQAAGDAPQEPEDGGAARPPAAAAAAAALLLVASSVSAALLCQHLAGGHHAPRYHGEGLYREDEVKGTDSEEHCGELMQNVIFTRPDVYVKVIDSVTYPSDCCTLCRQHKYCEAWTWGQAIADSDFAERCFLQHLGGKCPKDTRSRWHEQPYVLSGIPYNDTCSPKEKKDRSISLGSAPAASGAASVARGKPHWWEAITKPNQTPWWFLLSGLAVQANICILCLVCAWCYSQGGRKVEEEPSDEFSSLSDAEHDRAAMVSGLKPSSAAAMMQPQVDPRAPAGTLQNQPYFGPPTYPPSYTGLPSAFTGDVGTGGDLQLPPSYVPPSLRGMGTGYRADG